MGPIVETRMTIGVEVLQGRHRCPRGVRLERSGLRIREGIADADGRLVLSDVPAGTYELHAWAEGLGDIQTPNVAVPSGSGDYRVTSHEEDAMSPQYTYPGVYIEEVTGPGVIAGVGTSTAGSIGPAAAGPLLEPTRITSLDDYLRVFDTTRNGRPWPYLYDGSTPYYLGFAVEGFFRNGGTQAFVVRVGTAAQSSLAFQNQANEDAFVVRADHGGGGGDAVSVALGTNCRDERGDRQLGHHRDLGHERPGALGGAVPGRRRGDDRLHGSCQPGDDRSDPGEHADARHRAPNTVAVGDTLRIGDLLANKPRRFGS